MKIGDPLDRSVQHGPQNHAASWPSCWSIVTRGSGREPGSCWGKAVHRPGLFMEPTILVMLRMTCTLPKEESFGPIMVVSKVRWDVEEVVKQANNTMSTAWLAACLPETSTRPLYVSEHIDVRDTFVNIYNKLMWPHLLEDLSDPALGKIWEERP